MQNTNPLSNGADHNHLFSLAELSDQIVFSFDPETQTFLYLNPAANRIFQISDTNNQSNQVLEKIHPEDAGYLAIIYKKFLKKGGQTDAEFRIMLPDKPERWISVFACLLNKEKKPVIVGYGQDISHFKEHFKTLNKFASKKNAVLNILSHDLTGPLGSIQLITELLSRKVQSYSDEKEITNMIGWINSITKKSIQLIQEFVKQEFLESAGAALIKRRTNLVEIFKTAVEEYIRSWKEMKLDIRFVHSLDVLYINIDETKFMQVLHNLISNSIKFTPDGGQITITLQDQEKTVLITVQDTGIGIPEKYHAELFEKFTKARRNGLRGEQTVGLGMSVIKTIVEWHKGIIWFESAEDKGTTFYIELVKM